MNYKRSKYFTIRNKKKIKYLLIKKNSPITIVFFHGFMSDMTGSKPVAIQHLCKKIKINFLKFEYSGHGKSLGKFTNGNISQWTREAKLLIKSKIPKEQKLIFIGSSMGSWIALNLLYFFKRQISGFIGISSAPEFLEKIIWKKFTKKMKKIILEKKIYYLEYGGFKYPITKQLIFDGKKNRLIKNKIDFKIPVVLLHGSNDKVVPIKFSRNIYKNFTKSKKKLIIIKNGNHSLSRKKDLKKICSELNKMLKNIYLSI